MKPNLFLATFACPLLLPVAALAQDPDTDSQDVPVEAPTPPAEPADAVVPVEPEAGGAEEDDRLICESQTITGSRLAKRKICRTAEGWRRHRQDTKEHLRKALDRNSDVNSDYGVANPYG